MKRPPRIKGILHNGFHAQVKKNNKEIANLLVASASSLYASAVPEMIHAAEEMEGIATGIKEALIVSGLIGEKALNIPLNRPPGVAEEAQLLYAGKPGETFALGSMRFTLIGPTSKELRDLGKGWKSWMKAQPDEVKKVRAELKRRIEEFSSGALTTTPYDLGGWNGIPDFKKVTAPNVASLMFMVEETGAGNVTKRILLTGDGQQDFIVKGLERTHFLDPGFIHLDVLKVQHHGSEHNMDAAFARKVSADHYVFCGNGSHGNPDLRVINMVYASRRGDASVRTLAPVAQNRDFHFWFSTTSAAAPEGSERRDKFAAVEDRVAELKADSGGRLKVHYNQGSSIALQV